MCVSYRTMASSRLGFQKRRLKTSHMIEIALIFILTLYFGWTEFVGSRQVDVTGQSARRGHEAFFLHMWTRYVNSQPVKARDRAGFSEMGLRTKLYSILLANPDLKSFDTFESAIWPFASGIQQMRQHHTRVAKDKTLRKRGIVLSAGSKNFMFALHFIASIRRVHKSFLPIEVYYYGENDLPFHQRQHLETTFEGVRTIDIAALGLFDPLSTQLSEQGFALKPFALLATNLTEVILADADSVFLLPPEHFFLNEGYQRTGTLFFYDRHHNRHGIQQIIHKFLSEQLGLAGPSNYLKRSRFWQEKGIFQQESGVVVVNKSKSEVFAALLFAAWQNSGEIREQTTYRIFWGDKETFWLSFELARFEYHFMDAPTGAIGSISDSKNSEVCTEHPFHQLDVPASSDLETTDIRSNVKHAILRNRTRRLPAWFNGSLFHDKHRSTSIFLNATVWSTDGDWDFKAVEEKWCLQNFTSRCMSEHGIGTTLGALINVAKDLHISRNSSY